MVNYRMLLHCKPIGTVSFILLFLEAVPKLFPCFGETSSACPASFLTKREKPRKKHGFLRPN
jgi:hypothetical protein